MATAKTHRPSEEVARLGDEIFERDVRAKVLSEDEYKFLAIDVESGDFEVADDSYSAVMRLLDRNPEAEIWLRRVGDPCAHSMR